MDELPFCWMGLEDGPPARSCLAADAEFPLNFAPYTCNVYVRITDEGGLFWTDFTPRAVSSGTSGPSETAAPTPPSFKSKESAQKKRLNSTLERFILAPQSASPKLTFCYQRVAYVYKAKKERQGSKVRVIWGCVLSLCTSVSASYFLICEIPVG